MNRNLKCLHMKNLFSTDIVGGASGTKLVVLKLLGHPNIKLGAKISQLTFYNINTLPGLV